MGSTSPLPNTQRDSSGAHRSPAPFLLFTPKLTHPLSYQNQQDAKRLGLYSVDEKSQSVELRVDTSKVLAADGSEGGRPSVRIESKESYNHGLVIGDFAHMPGSVCGSWPDCESSYHPCPPRGCDYLCCVCAC